MSVQSSVKEMTITRIVVDGKEVPGVAEAKASIALTEDGNVQGYGGCNRFFGGYRLEGESISFSPIASTRRYCEETMAVEDALFVALGKVTKLKFSAEGFSLLSEDGDNEVAASKERLGSDG